MFKNLKKKFGNNRSWKEKNKKYLKELQSFLDKAENIEDENLRKVLIGQMLKCDDILTKLAEERFKDFYKIGYRKAIKNNFKKVGHT